MDHLPLVHAKDAVLAKEIILRVKRKFHPKNLSANVRLTSLCLFITSLLQNKCIRIMVFTSL